MSDSDQHIDGDTQQGKDRQPSNNDNDVKHHKGRSLSSVKRRMWENHPKLMKVFDTILSDPLSGDTIRLILDSEEEQIPPVNSLPSPIYFQRNSPIIVSHYANFASDMLPQYWNTVFPDLKQRYEDVIRYEHHDLVNPQRESTEYKLATIGRAVQHRSGPTDFWRLFNYIMHEGVTSIDDTYEAIKQLQIDVDLQYVEKAIYHRVYDDVFYYDIEGMLSRCTPENEAEFQRRLENNEAHIVIFVNGTIVRPMYDSITAEIERQINELSV